MNRRLMEKIITIIYAVCWDCIGAKKGQVKEKMEKKDRLEVLYVRPNEEAKFIEIDNDIDSMQELVDGFIEEYMPFDDEVAVICNEEGKIKNLDFNRGIYDENGKLLDIICGSFFLCYAPIESEKFLPLPANLRTKYEKKFKAPEQFFLTENGIVAKKLPCHRTEYDRDVR